jgi:pimeloyl-ACP methyl ester carboxylesterase
MAPLNYEIHGTGEPLVLLGAGIEFFPTLADVRQVIAVDLETHVCVEAMADAVAALIRHLGIGKTDIIGYSTGGMVALRTAVQHPGVVDTLFVSAACN